MNCPPLEENFDEYRSIQFSVGKKRVKFIDGTWVVGQHAADSADIGGMKRQIQRLEEANNLSQIKIDVLLDMLTENLAELNMLRDK